MKSVLRYSLLLLSLGIMLTGCNEEHVPAVTAGEDLFPVVEGGRRIYHVIDTSYETSSSQGFDARTYYKMESTEGTEEDLLGRDVSKLWIWTSPDTIGTPDAPVYNWSFDELWTQYLGEEYAERIEGNTRLLVLRVPAYEGSTWNGNLFNNEDVQTYEYVNTDTTVTIRGVTYEHCVYVLQVPFRKPVEQQGGPFFLIEHAYEIYAPGIGKIVRYCKFYEEQRPQAGQLEINTDSKTYYEELVSHNY